MTKPIEQVTSSKSINHNQYDESAITNKSEKDNHSIPPDFTPLIIIGSNSVHTIRYIKQIQSFYPNIILITNNTKNIDLSSNIKMYKFSFKLTNLKTRYQIAKIIKDNPNAIVHVHQANSYAFHALKGILFSGIKCKTILTVWGSDVLILPHKNIIYKRIVQFNLAGFDIITSDSLYVSSQITKLSHSIKKICTINFGVESFPNQIVNFENKKDIILSNRLHKSLYNIDHIILAFKQLSKNPTLDNYRLIIAAEGPDTDKLKQLSTTLELDKRVEFVGMVSYQELQKLYKQARIIVSIPDSDATSMSLLESMSFGCYPVLSNIPANLEWIIDGINGKISSNLEQLSHDILEAITTIEKQHDYYKIAQINHEVIKAKAVLQTNIQKFLELYK